MNIFMLLILLVIVWLMCSSIVVLLLVIFFIRVVVYSGCDMFSGDCRIILVRLSILCNVVGLDICI